MSLTVQNITKSFSDFAALDNVSFEAHSGEFLALLGPSGSGKTTLLRLLAGLDQPDSGSVTFEGEDYLALNARERRIGMVFQSYALFRHMTVEQNIAFGLNVRPAKDRPSKAEIKAKVQSLLKLIQLEDLGKRFPSQLSGGQRQRVALARALAISPRILLLDEPFGALDALVRKDLRRWLRRIHDETGVTTIFVTHDQEEALDLADRVVVLKDGQIEQIGKPLELYRKPASSFVFDFLGTNNQVTATVSGAEAKFEGFTAPAVVSGELTGPQVVRFRPFDAHLSKEGPGFKGKVLSILPAGANLRLEVQAEDGTVFETQHAHDSDASDLKLGDTVYVRPTKVYVFGN
ncbi:sulfate/molybdate ABC transporter ATP-binding protein [Asticcacaulis sp. ZE23SCel15]|uniref:sulfate/molybdate ABC transporter ATP-binding protein n=1 Tax=Asticcacaulis sp. ZE23SCel15 TaxID=3059027 RepID=UPI0026603E7D|nr:sulfate/molybdate ABC transporter ATP-binding protein [Asticcacaulis sp. ZE23SCel15]WKL58834.1 sulfate/molybdate ABC transporter ATP-binding protein [Asticcacaulis sp. ZE23SCel15]